MLYRWYIDMYKKCEKVKRQNDSETNNFKWWSLWLQMLNNIWVWFQNINFIVFGAVYTSEIWKEPRKPAKKSTPILKKHVQKKKIYIKN